MLINDFWLFYFIFFLLSSPLVASVINTVDAVICFWISSSVWFQIFTLSMVILPSNAIWSDSSCRLLIILGSDMDTPSFFVSSIASSSWGLSKAGGIFWFSVPYSVVIVGRFLFRYCINKEYENISYGVAKNISIIDFYVFLVHLKMMSFKAKNNFMHSNIR